jgi:RNA polymerase sigma factor (sigma-70 family)
MRPEELIPNLFRTEYSKITAVLCKRFGIEHLEVAEDIASETFLAALNNWPYKGIPENPTAWLYLVAKNKARNYLVKVTTFQEKVAEHIRQPVDEVTTLDLSDKNIMDSQLQMLFAICHPVIPAESQIALALRILCGFGIDEIANAFLTNKETINKRLFRAREKLRTEKIVLELPPEQEIRNRMEAVLTTLYLLFNEGYYSETHEVVLREELCVEAMRLTYMLTGYKETDRPNVHALLALMCFHASRFEARKSGENGNVLYADQDESLWNRELIAKGAASLQRASNGNSLSRYHLEASIAYWYTIKADTSEKWDSILQLYNRLLMMHYSPIAALNRTYALSKVKGKREAIVEAEKLKLTDNPFYFTLLGELYKGIDAEKARNHFEQALALAKTQADRHIIEGKIKQL